MRSTPHTRRNMSRFLLTLMILLMARRNFSTFQPGQGVELTNSILTAQPLYHEISAFKVSTLIEQKLLVGSKVSKEKVDGLLPLQMLSLSTLKEVTKASHPRLPLYRPVMAFLLTFAPSHDLLHSFLTKRTDLDSRAGVTSTSE